MEKQRVCKNCWFYEADGTKWISSKTATVAPKPNEEWCCLDNQACPASRTCPSWMSTQGSAPAVDAPTTKQEKAEAKKEKRRLRKLAKKEENEEAEKAS